MTQVLKEGCILNTPLARNAQASLLQVTMMFCVLRVLIFFSSHEALQVIMCCPSPWAQIKVTNEYFSQSKNDNKVFLF
jgi:hypothetical protein